MHDVAFRPAEPTDLGAISRLLVASYGVLLAAAYDPGLLAQALPKMTKANPTLVASGRYYVAETRDGAVVAGGGWSTDRPGTREIEAGLGHVRHFATDPAWTGRGLGRAILGRCLEAAREAGCNAMECLSTLNGEPFYAACGFATAGRVMVQIGGEVEFPAVLMRRTLT